MKLSVFSVALCFGLFASMANARLLKGNGVGANQGSARQTPRGKKVECDTSDFDVPCDSSPLTLKQLGDVGLCGQPVDTCLWYIGLREVNCECGDANACPEQGGEFCAEGFELTRGVKGGFWTCNLIEPDDEEKCNAP